MRIVHSEKHKLRDAKTELFGGELVAPFERPSRLTHILDQIQKTGAGPIEPPRDFGMAPILKIHDAGLVEFLQTAVADWKAAGMKGEAIPSVWNARRSSGHIPDFIDGKLGYYAMSTETSLTDGSWEAAYHSAQVALTGADILHTKQATCAFSLCRPPGHHAALDMYGGYCFLNNAAIAAQSFLDHGAARVAILDVDFHHGNGTQDIFYDRDDVMYLSLHGDPKEAFPHFWGHADEVGTGQGAGFTHNYPMPPDTGFDVWREALHKSLAEISRFNPDYLIISLGVDAFENDPISFFKLRSADFTTLGGDIASLGLPTLFVMEGGYDIGEIGLNTVNTLHGFESEAPQ